LPSRSLDSSAVNRFLLAFSSIPGLLQKWKKKKLQDTKGRHQSGVSKWKMLGGANT
jgi:hypothetical protein